jgi:hypothetical protein
MMFVSRVIAPLLEESKQDAPKQTPNSGTGGPAMSPDELALVYEKGCDRPRLGIVVMARVPGKTLVSFGKTIQTVSNENILEVKDA